MAVAIPLCTISCSLELEITSNQSGENPETSVHFLLEIPGVAHPASRSLSNADEGHVSTVDVMVFSSGQYRFTQTAHHITAITESKKSFEVKLPLGTYDLVVIANGRANIQAGNFYQGQTKANVLNTLEHSHAAGIKWTSHIPMWGERNNVTINENTSLAGSDAIKLTRMISKIEVALEAAAAGANNSNFAITSVRLYNYNTAGKLVPDLVTGWDYTSYKTTSPHLPATPGKTVGPLVYTAADDPSGTLFTPSSVINTIYTFEAAAGSAGTRLGNTCVVVGGSYKGSSSDTHFYRMDFITTDNQVSTYLPLLRNHKYTFTIHSITGPGFPTPEEAFHAGPVNIEADIIAWNEGDMHHVVFDNQSTLSVSQDRFTFGYGACNSEEEDNVLYIFTDYTNSALGAVSGWYIEKIVDAATQAPINWLTATPNHGAPDNKDKVVLTYQQNSSGSDRYATLWIAAGRLRFPIHITQYRQSKIRIGGIGLTGGYGYNPVAAGTSHHCAYNMLTSANNFGTNKNSTVFTHGFLLTSYGAAPTNTQVQEACDNSDIIFITYSYTGNNTHSTILADYVKRGGVLILFWDATVNLANLMNAILGTTTVTSGLVNAAGAIYQINPDVDDMITNGPFGDLRGKHWGEDATSTGYIPMSAMPAESYTLYTTGANRTNDGGNANYLTSFRLNNYNVVFVGDGGLLSTEQTTSFTVCPFRLDANYAPIPKLYGSSKHFDVYNSALFGNIMAWALSRVGN